MINPEYLQKENWQKLQEAFRAADFPSITLFDFFNEDFYIQLKEEMIKLDYHHEHKLLFHSYAVAEVPDEILNIFNSPEFLKIMSVIINKKIKIITPKAYLFSWKDYTILHDQALEELGTDLIFDFTDDWSDKAGGTIIYKDEEGNFVKLPVVGNMLAIVERKEGVQKFLQYVNHYGTERKRYLIFSSLK